MTAVPPLRDAAPAAGAGNISADSPDAGGPGTGGRGMGGPGMASGWRRWRAPALLVAFVLLGGVAVALLASPPPVTGELDPRSTGPTGTHALAALLTRRGQLVTTAGTAAAAAAQARGPDTTLVITNPPLLGPASLSALARASANTVIVAPDRAVLSRFAPGVTLAGTAPVGLGAPRCGLAAARYAGTADMGGLTLRSAAPGAWRCYPAGLPGQPGLASLVRYRRGGRTITVLGTGAPLTNARLGSAGNAALALNLLDTGRRVVWLVPDLSSAAGSTSGQRSLLSLIPSAAYLVFCEIGVAVLLAAAWRMRRFRPLVAEPLPVVVRASETVEGHGRLYRSHRARDRAAAALRAAALTRMSARLGLPREVSPTVVAHEAAARTGRDSHEVEAILDGPVPPDEAALVALATDLDTLERQVLTQ